jgi:multiple sugar transport system ATP-binding protein
MQGVELINLNKLYGTVHVVKDVQLTLQSDEFVVLVGPSGCGKTTTLRMVAGLESISSGDLMIDGRRANDLSPAERDIAMVFQNYALYPNMNVYDNMAFGLRNRGATRAQVAQEIKRAADVLGIEKLLERKPRQLSGGQQQRVALGRCLVRHPKVFLFDEPLSNLDAKLRLEMRQELKRLKARISATSIYVTHDQVEAMTLGDRVVVMSQGIVQQAGSPEEIYHRPSNIFVATFVGSPPMNLIEAAVIDHAGGQVFHAGSMEFAVPPRLAKALSNKGSTVLVGIRPEHIQLGCGGPTGSESFVSGTIDLTELLGSEQLVQVRVGDRQITVTRVDPFLRLAPGEPVSLTFSAEHLHVFDPTSGLSLSTAHVAHRSTAATIETELRPLRAVQ